MEIDRSSLIVSKAGRDKGQLFFVIDADEQYVYLADGKSRKLEKPKRKKRKQLDVRKGEIFLFYSYVPWRQGKLDRKPPIHQSERQTRLRYHRKVSAISIIGKERIKQFPLDPGSFCILESIHLSRASPFFGALYVFQRWNLFFQ